MSLTQEQIARLGKLTSLTPNNDISVDSVLDSFDALSRMDTSSNTIVSRSGKSIMTPREDIVIHSYMDDALLSCSPQKKTAHQIVLGGIIAWE